MARLSKVILKNNMFLKRFLIRLILFRVEDLKKLEEENKPNAYEMIYVDEMRNRLANSKMVAIFHANFMGHHPKRKVRFIFCLYLCVIINYIKPNPGLASRKKVRF